MVAYHYEQDSFRPIAQEIDGELNYIVTDDLGTPREMLSEEGEIQWSAQHHLWGRTSKSRKPTNGKVKNCLLSKLESDPVYRIDMFGGYPELADWSKKPN